RRSVARTCWGVDTLTSSDCARSIRNASVTAAASDESPDWFSNSATRIWSLGASAPAATSDGPPVDSDNLIYASHPAPSTAALTTETARGTRQRRDPRSGQAT